jgi:hypothetical protein
MANFSAHPAFLNHFLARLQKVRKSGPKGWIACCPAHDDQNPSLGVSLGQKGKILVHCHAGCSAEEVVQALGLNITDLFPPSSLSLLSHRGLSLVEFAREKKLPWSFLVNQGVTEDPQGGLRISYYNLDGTPALRFRIRTDLVAKQGSFWNKKPGEILPYGLEHLEAVRQKGWLFLVEGETDTLTLRLHGYPALGIPGAEMVKTTMQHSYIDGINRLYILQEPDAAGQRFAEDILSLLTNWSWGGNAYVVSLPDTKDPSELHQRDPKGFPAAFQQALDAASLRYDGSPAQDVLSEPPAMIQQPEQVLDSLFTLQHLLNMPFANPRWAIPGLLPEGLLLLVGKPKQGKSWLALQFAFAVAAGGAILGAYQANLGEVLFLALEDTPQRLQARSQRVLSTMTAPPQSLTFAIQWPRLDQGGLTQLETFAGAHPHLRLIVIDTWAMLAPGTPSRSRSYETEYAGLAPLKQFASAHHVSLLLVHHLRKTPGQDVLDEITGSTGLIGVVDGMLILKRVREQEEASLFVTGRDLPEQSLSLLFDPTTAQWKRGEDHQEKDIERSVS